MGQYNQCQWNASGEMNCDPNLDPYNQYVSALINPEQYGGLAREIDISVYKPISDETDATDATNATVTNVSITTGAVYVTSTTDGTNGTDDSYAINGVDGAYACVTTIQYDDSWNVDG